MLPSQNFVGISHLTKCTICLAHLILLDLVILLRKEPKNYGIPHQMQFPSAYWATRIQNNRKNKAVTSNYFEHEKVQKTSFSFSDNTSWWC
jgi:hypothetical protein